MLSRVLARRQNGQALREKTVTTKHCSLPLALDVELDLGVECELEIGLDCESGFEEMTVSLLAGAEGSIVETHVVTGTSTEI